MSNFRSSLEVPVPAGRPTLARAVGHRRARDHGAFEVEVLDLRDWPLPIFAETFQTVGDFNDPTYSSPLVRSWNRKVAEADAYLVITPEYNHSVPAVLKNAIDSVFVSFAFETSRCRLSATAAGSWAGYAPLNISHRLLSRPR